MLLGFFPVVILYPLDRLRFGGFVSLLFLARH
jgi:hypothetical protein